MRQLTCESNLSGAAAAGVRAHVWIPAHCFFSRSDAQHHCWLWLLRGNGQVRALLLPARHLGNDALLPELVRLCKRDDSEIPTHPELGGVRALPHAPIVPLPRWAVSWGHPVQRAIRAFAAHLDTAVLEALGALEVSNVFFGAVKNYNALIRVPAEVRARRLQALANFPAWLAPVLLQTFERPEMFGSEDDLDGRWHDPTGFVGMLGGARQGRRPARDDVRLLEAIDHGRDLIGAIAAAYRVDRALVRAPLGRMPWPRGGMPATVIALLQAIPAHARPAQAADVTRRLDSLDAMPARLQSRADVQRLARPFAQGWNAVWDALERDAPNLQREFRDCHDFLNAALRAARLPATLAGMDVNRLALAWLARRGPRALLEASRRWHRPAVVQRPPPSRPLPAPQPGMTLVALFGSVQLPQGSARELLDAEALLDEGEAMVHCVGDYWDTCLYDGSRIAHLETPDGEMATLQLGIEMLGSGSVVRNLQLSGPGNAEPSAAMAALAEAVVAWLSRKDDALAVQIERIVEQAHDAQEKRPAYHAPAPVPAARALDARLRTELAQVLAYAEKQADWQRPIAVRAVGQVAGFQYGQGARVLHALRQGDALTLVREPANPHDPLAVRIDWRGQKLGYVPRADNPGIARRLDQGDVLDARIHALHEEAWSPVVFVIELGQDAESNAGTG